MSTFVGIDVAKSKSTFNIYEKNISRKKVKEFSMNKKGFDKLLFYTRDLNEPLYFMESTGIYHLTLLQYLLNHNLDCYIINPVLIKNYVKSNNLRLTKTDTIDAIVIADYAYNNFNILKKANRQYLNDIKSLARRRERISKDVTRLKIQLKVDLSICFPEILSTDVYGKGIMNLLAEFSSPKDIINASYKEISDAIRAGTKGCCINITPLELQRMAKSSVGINSYSYMVKDTVENLMHVINRLDKVTKRILEIIEHEHSKELKILQSIPGVGKITAAHFIAEVSNIEAFPCYQKLIAYCGTDPGIYQSGKYLVQGHITKHGNKSLRRCLYIMGMNILRYSNYFQSYYYKKKGEGFCHRKAMVALINKLIKTIFAMLTKGQEFIEPKIILKEGSS